MNAHKTWILTSQIDENKCYTAFMWERPAIKTKIHADLCGLFIKHNSVKDERNEVGCNVWY